MYKGESHFSVTEGKCVQQETQMCMTPFKDDAQEIFVVCGRHLLFFIGSRGHNLEKKHSDFHL